ncbi:MAG: methyltransferase domain-containing protein [Chloroflexi bacterium]|nr:methyltransferase domain-containing protein [Chloroflexota bacterium]
MIIELFRSYPFLSVIVVVVVFLVLSQAAVIGAEYFLRWKRFRQAETFARQQEKPLLVIGRPGSPVRIYGCGDHCLDADPRVLVDCPRGGVVGDIRDIPFSDDYFGAVFCSHIVEFMPTVTDAETALKEMERVGGRLFLCHTHPLNLVWGWFGPTTRMWIARKRTGLVFRKRPW